MPQATNTSYSQPQAIRIAIALVALRYKPVDQTYESYVLDLRAKFPLSLHVNEVALQWRRRALTLERELQALRETRDAEQVELAVLQSKLIDRSSPPLPPSPPPTGNKKKQKKKAAKTQSNPTSTVEMGVLKRAEDLKLKLGALSGQRCSQGALLTSFEQLNVILVKKHTDLGLVCAATHRALDSVTSPLKVILQCSSASTVSSTATGLLDAATILVPQLMVSVLPLLDSECTKTELSKDELTSASGNLLRRLVESLLRPMLASFYLLSRTLLITLLSPPKRKSGSSSLPRPVLDFRPQISTLLQAVIESLRTVYVSFPNRILSAQIRDLFELMTLQSVRELDCLYSNEPKSPSSASRTALNSTRTDHMPTENLGETTPWATSTPDRSHSRPRGGGGVTKDGRNPTLGLGTNSNPDIAQVNQNREDQLNQLAHTDRRVLKLARKDTMWYLCNVVHLMFSEMDEIDVSNERGVVNEAVRRNQMDRAGWDHSVDRDGIYGKHGQHGQHEQPQQHHRHRDSDALAMGTLGTRHSINGIHSIDPSSFSPSPSGLCGLSEPHRQDYRNGPPNEHSDDQDPTIDSTDADNRNNPIANPDDRYDPNDFRPRGPDAHEITGSAAHDCDSANGDVDNNSLERNLAGLLGEAVIASLSGLLRRTCVSSVAVCHTTRMDTAGEGGSEGIEREGGERETEEEGKDGMDVEMSDMSTLRNGRGMSTGMERMDEVESRMVMALVERAWLRMS